MYLFFVEKLSGFSADLLNNLGLIHSHKDFRGLRAILIANDRILLRPHQSA